MKDLLPNIANDANFEKIKFSLHNTVPRKYGTVALVTHLTYSFSLSLGNIFFNFSRERVGP